MAARKLGSIYARFAWRTDRILTAFQTPLPANAGDAANCRFIHDAGTTHLVNRLQVLWGEYCRNIIIRSARGNALTITGNWLAPAPGIAGFPQIRAKLGNSFGSGSRTHWEEPAWALGCANLLTPVNGNQISLGLGAAPVKDLKRVRNFLIHPNERTKNEYLSLARDLGYPNLEPQMLLAAAAGNDASVIGYWINQFQTSALEAAR